MTTPNYPAIEEHCKQHSDISQRVIDKKLLYHAAAHSRLDKKFDDRVKEFKHVTRDWDPVILRYIKSTYIIGKTFGENGLIHSYFEKKHFDHYPQDECEFLSEQSSIPWRYCYTIIEGQPAQDFFEMVDVFTDETYLFYSPGIEEILKTERPRMWFNLIAYNGQCWQTTGLIMPLNAFTPNDVFFYASEINPEIEDEVSLMREVHENPIPFLMLFKHGQAPISLAGDQEIRFQFSLEEYEPFELDSLKSRFRISRYKEFLQIAPLSHEAFPHFARAIFNEKANLLSFNALTLEGYQALWEQLVAEGFDFSDEPEIDLSMTMYTAIGEILGKEPEFIIFGSTMDEAAEKNLLVQITDHPEYSINDDDLTDYDELEEDHDDELWGEEELNEEEENGSASNSTRINHFLRLLIPEINSGKEIDLPKLAAEVGMKLADAQATFDGMMKVVNKYKMN